MNTRSVCLQKLEHENCTGQVQPQHHQDVIQWLDATDKGRVIKDNAARTVWVWERPDREAWVVKKYTSEGLLDRLRNLILGSRAHKEFKVLSAMNAEGMPVPQAIAAFTDAAGSAYLVSAFIPNARPLKELFVAGWPRHSEKIRVLEELAAFAHRLHERGVFNRDLHIGNILVQEKPFRLTLIDAQRVSLYSHLSVHQCLYPVAFMLHSFYTFVTLQDCTRFLKAYFAGELHPEALIRQVWELFDRIRFDYYRSRDRHILTSRRTTERQKRDDGTVITMVRGTHADEILALAENLQKLQCFKFLPGRALYLDGAKRYVKVIQYSGLEKKLEYWIKGPPALRIWFNTQALKNRGIDTPECFAALESSERGVVVGEWLPEAVPLNEYVEKTIRPAGRREKLDFINALAGFIRRVHACGVCHRDLKANNILNYRNRFYLIDLDRVGFYGSVLHESQRKLNLAQLNAAIGMTITKSDRLRFFKTYTARDRTTWEKRKSWIRDIMQLTRARKHVWP